MSRIKRDEFLQCAGSVDMTPHYVTRRFAELVAALMKLHCSSATEIGSSSASLGIAGGGDSMLLGDLQQIRVEMTNLLEKLAVALSGAKEQKVFLINNLDLILSVFQDRRLPSNDEVQKYEDMLMQQRELFAEEEVKHAFPRLISFVLLTEQQIANEAIAPGAGRARVTVDESVVEGLIRDFSNSWKIGIQQINDDVLVYFANFRNGMEILKQVKEFIKTMIFFAHRNAFAIN